MKLEDLQKLMAIDSVVDKTELDTESLKIPQIHNKYMNFLLDEKQVLLGYEFKYKHILRKKWEYYTGKMSVEECKQMGWEPFQLKILRTDLDLYLDSDKELENLKISISTQNLKIELLESFIKTLNNRHWYIRSCIDWKKFTSGVS